MKHTRQKSKGTWRHMLMLSVLLVAVVALVLGAASPDCWARGGDHGDDDDEIEMSFDVAEIFFELNDTDGDLGIHALIDGEPWKKLEIEDPRDRKMLDIYVKGRLRRQGLTELFFESAEPSFDELSPRRFFRRFPAGWYEIEGTTLEGDELESMAWLSHVMPAPPANIRINDVLARPEEGEECDEEELPTVSGEVTIEWDPVTESHPWIGENDPEIEIVRYQVVAEWEDEDENVYVFSADLPAPAPGDLGDRMSITVPAEFFEEGTEFKVEVLVREASGNQTAVESCPFEWEEEEPEE